MSRVDCDTCLYRSGCPIPQSIKAEDIECGNYKPVDPNKTITFDQLQMIFDALNKDLVDYGVKLTLRFEGTGIHIGTEALSTDKENDHGTNN